MIPFLRQHVVEFIRGTGIRTDGVLNSVQTGPIFTWTVPEGVVELIGDYCGGGGAGGGGYNIGSTRGGGGGGSPGACYRGARLVVRPKSTLTITVGAGSNGGAAGSAGGEGGDTTISGILISASTRGQTYVIAGRGTGGNSGGFNNGGQGGSHPTYSYSGGWAGVTSGGGPGNVISVQTGTQSPLGGTWLYSSGGGGGAPAATGTVAGQNGGSNDVETSLIHALYPYNIGLNGVNGGIGTTASSISYGGGGAGGHSMFGLGGSGGNGNAVGGNATGYGAGGGGGGGGAAGGNGAPGYVRLVYWSAE